MLGDTQTELEKQSAALTDAVARLEALQSQLEEQATALEEKRLEASGLQER